MNYGRDSVVSDAGAAQAAGGGASCWRGEIVWSWEEALHQRAPRDAGGAALGMLQVGFLSELISQDNLTRHTGQPETCQQLQFLALAAIPEDIRRYWCAAQH